MSPTSATIDRQILVTYRASEDAVNALLPRPFRARLFKNQAIAALSLVRLKPPKPRLMPSLITTQPEHIAHQIAVEWNSNGDTRAGWYILRRDTTARSVVLGGSIFPGKLFHGRFHVHEQDSRFRINCDSDDDQSHVRVDAFAADFLPKEAIFATLEEATTFLQPASTLYTSATPTGELEGMEIRPKDWPIRAMALWESTSTFLENLIPKESLTLDCAMLLRNVDYEWITAPALTVGFASADPLLPPANE
jgi:hypothetical protein